MKRRTIALAALFLATIISALIYIFVEGGNKQPYTIKNGMIHFAEPERAEGQTSRLGFAAEPIDTVRVGIIGLGQRGCGPLKRMSFIDGVKIVAICDLHQKNLDRGQKRLEKYGMPRADEYIGEEAWKELCKREDINLVYIVTDWSSHTPMAVYAMEHGKHVAIEVPAATSVAECWQLVDTSERTRRHCMMLENCIYDHFEFTTLNMAQQGLFGEILHVEGAYIHNLEEFWHEYQGNWRLKYNQQHRGDVYATHGLGPICQLLNIHRGDRLDYLVSVDTKPVVGRKLYTNATGENPEDFKNGDQTTTLIRTANGKTIHLFHNVVTPRPYSRGYSVVGTEGYVEKYPFENIMIGSEVEEGVNPNTLGAHKFMPEKERKALLEKYKHPIIIETEEMAKKVGGHGGMDYILDYRLVYCLRHGLPLDVDVYDLAEWSCVVALSGISLENGSVPVAVPDFTRGAWNKLQGYKHAMKE